MYLDNFSHALMQQPIHLEYTDCVSAKQHDVTTNSVSSILQQKTLPYAASILPQLRVSEVGLLVNIAINRHTSVFY